MHFHIITDMFPDNIINSMADGNLMQIIVFSVFLGVALVILGDKAEKAKNMFAMGSTIMCKLQIWL